MLQDSEPAKRGGGILNCVDLGKVNNNIMLIENRRWGGVPEKSRWREVQLTPRYLSIWESELGNLGSRWERGGGTTNCKLARKKKGGQLAEGRQGGRNTGFENTPSPRKARKSILPRWCRGGKKEFSRDRNGKKKEPSLQASGGSKLQGSARGAWN